MDPHDIQLSTESLAPCSSRVCFPAVDEFFCLHLLAKTHSGFVNVDTCRDCVVRSRPSPGRRSIPNMSAPKAGVSLPGTAAQLLSVAGAAARFVADGMRLCSDDVYRARLEVCKCCDQLLGDRCAACGCFVSVKARGRALKCPVGKWPDDTAAAEES